MKKLLFTLLLFVCKEEITAQTFDEWFRQSKTQKKYLLQQIAALQLYTVYLQKGYSIAKRGLNTIGTITKSDLGLHSIFFNSLKTVNSNISHYAAIADIISLQLTIVQLSHGINALSKNSNDFTPFETRYISRVYNRVLMDCAASTDDLISLTTHDQLEMKDDERIRRMDEINRKMHDTYLFAKSFGNQTRVMAAARAKEKKDIINSRALNGLP